MSRIIANVLMQSTTSCHMTHDCLFVDGNTMNENNPTVHFGYRDVTGYTTLLLPNYWQYHIVYSQDKRMYYLTSL